jgi:phosphohistidine phosphatase SixA
MIVFVLRHADRTAADDLSAAGKRRAELLARMLADTGITVAFRSEAKRAAMTLQPLQAELPGLRIEEIKLAGAADEDAYAKTIAAAVRALPAAAVVAVVGHSNTLGPTIHRLGGGPIEPIGDNEFDNLFVLFIDPNGAATLLKMRYGEPT